MLEMFSAQGERVELEHAVEARGAHWLGPALSKQARCGRYKKEKAWL